MIEFVNNHCKISLRDSVHYFDRDDIADIRMDVEEYYDYNSTTILKPTIKIYVKKWFLWCIPYKSLNLEITPYNDFPTDDVRKFLKSYYSKLYEWWKFRDEN
jgi:hypothetical protein